MRKLRRALLLAAGSVSIAVGIVGIFMPVLPTTPFLLLGAACYARGSRRFYRWLMCQRTLGAYIRNYREGRGMRRGAKISALVLLWASLGYSAVAVAHQPAPRALLLAINLGMTIHLLKLPTYSSFDNEEPDRDDTGCPPGGRDAREYSGDKPL